MPHLSSEQGARDSEGRSIGTPSADSDLRDLFEHAAFGIYRAEAKGERFLDVNAALVEILRYESKAELLAVGLESHVYIPPGARAAVLETLRKFGRVKDHEVRWRRRDGATIMVLLSGRLVRQRDGTPWFVEMFVNDVTDQRRHEERLQQARKLEALGRITGAIAHDFNNLLAAIVTPAEFLLQDLDRESPQWEDVRSIYQAATRAADLTGQLLAFSRRRVLQPTRVRLNDVLEGMSHLLPRLAGERVEVEIRVPSDLPPVLAEASQMEQVLVNLVVNARDALPHGGRILIEATARGPLGDPVLPEQASHVVLTVTDDGEGMDADTCDRVFDPFFTTKPQGTGLGLATVAAIVKQHQGEIHVESELGRGTRFVISIPVAVAGAPRPEKPEPAVPAVVSQGSILIVEDEPDVAHLVRRALSRAGYEASIAPSGEAAIEQIRAGVTPCALLIDMMLPGIDGLETARRARSLAEDVQIIYMSGFAGVEVTAAVERDKSALSLQKPFTVSQLFATIEEALARRAANVAKPGTC